MRPQMSKELSPESLGFDPRRRPWIKFALCQGRPPKLFFPEKGKGESNVGLKAKKICIACGVKKNCLTYAIENNEKNGVWGGCGEKTRRYLERVWQQKECDGYAWAWSDIECECVWCEALENAVEQDTVFNSNGPNATHGLRVTYARGCRCNPCKFAAANYSLTQRNGAA